MSENQGRTSGTSTPAKSPAPSSTPQAANVAAHGLASHAPSHVQVSQIGAQNVQAQNSHMNHAQAQQMLTSQSQHMMTSQSQQINPSQAQPMVVSHSQVISSQPQHMLTSQSQQMISQSHLMSNAHSVAQSHVQTSHQQNMPQSTPGQPQNQPSIQHVVQPQMVNLQHAQNQQANAQHVALQHENQPHPQQSQPPSQQPPTQQTGQHVPQGGINQVSVPQDGQQVSVMSMVANPGIAHQVQAGGMVRVTLPVNIQNIQGLQTVAGMQQIQQVPGVQHIQGVQQVQGVPQMPGLNQMQGIQQVQGVQGIHQVQGAQGFQGLPQGVQVIQNAQFLPQQVLPGHQAIFQNQGPFHAFPGSVMSPAINIQHMQQQQQAAGAAKNQAATGVISHNTLHQAQVQQGIQLQTQQPQQQQQSSTQQQNSSSTSSPSKVSVASSRPTHVVAGQPAAQQQQQLMGQKQIAMPRQGQPVVIGQFGVISNQAANNQAMLNQQKSPIIAQTNQAQVIGSPTQIRFQNQIIQPVMSMNQFPQMGMPGNISIAQPIFAASQSTGQQVYLRPANLNQAQQTVQVQVLNNKPKEGVQMKGATVKTLTPQIQGVLTPGTRLQTVQMTPGPVRVGTTLGQVTPRVRPPVKVKATSPRVIQPKPSISTVQSSPTHAPTLAVQPKVQSKVLPVTRVVTATTSPRITPVETKSSTPNVYSQASSPTKALDTSISSVVTSQSVVSTPDHVLSGEPTKPTTVVTTVSSTTEPSNKFEQQDKKENITSVSISSTPVSSVLDPIIKPVSEKKQAIVKPVLTHVIEGFVIQEAVEPFPIQRSNPIENLIPTKSEDEMEKERLGLPKNAVLPPVPGEEIKLQCEYCGNTAALRKFKNSKRFCSKLCAKRYSVGCSKRIGSKTKSDKQGKLERTRKRPRIDQPGAKHWKRNEDGGRVNIGGLQRDGHGQGMGMGNSSQSDDDDRQMHAGVETTSETESQMTTTTDSSLGRTEESPSEPRSPPELERQVDVHAPAQDAAYARKHITQWNVEDVATFIRSLPGCDIYVEEFTKQEIDGQALSLLKEDHLMSAMNIKLGPALKICASIKQFQEEGA